MRSPQSLLLSGFLCVQLAFAEQALIQDTNYEDGGLGPSPAQSFQVAQFTPVEWNFVLPTNDSTSSKISSGLLFTAPRGTSVAQPGGAIWAQDGTLVYSASGFGETMTFYKVKYKNADHLLIWQGQFELAGYGFGHNLLLNASYDVVANFTTGPTLGANMADLHDAQITSDNTALMTAYPVQQKDLSQWQGPSSGFIAGGAFQELDIATGKEIFTWNSLDHVDPSESMATPGSTGGDPSSPWDYFHINAVSKDSSGNYLISSRHCHTIYYIDGKSGNIIWRMGGTKSDFTIGDGAGFSWQHDARFVNNNTVSVFDNAASDFAVNGPTARGLILNFDTNAKTVTLVKQMLPFVANYSTSQGNVQVMGNGNTVIGWGARPYFSEYDPDGNLLWAVHFGVGDVQSYRAYRFTWTGRPRTPPTIGFSNDSSSNTLVASWNGATEIDSWELFGSTSDQPQKAISLNTTKKTDFETSITYTGDVAYAFYQVAAKNANGKYLGYSNFESRNGNVVAAAANQTVTAPPLDDDGTSGSGNTGGSNSSNKNNGGMRLTSAGSLQLLVVMVVLPFFAFI